MDDHREFKIDKDIPLPLPRGKAGFPFEKMEVGDSFEVSKQRFASASGARKTVQNKTGWRFTARRMSDQTFRIWRVK